MMSLVLLALACAFQFTAAAQSRFEKRRIDKIEIAFGASGANASLAEIGGLAGVATAKAVNGAFVITLAPGVDQREFLKRAGKDGWKQYAQVLLSSNEFAYVD